MSPTGPGHGSATAVLLGLSGERPELCDPRTVTGTLEQIRAARRVSLLGEHEIDFVEEDDLIAAVLDRFGLGAQGLWLVSDTAAQGLTDTHAYVEAVIGR